MKVSELEEQINLEKGLLTDEEILDSVNGAYYHALRIKPDCQVTEAEIWMNAAVLSTISAMCLVRILLRGEEREN